MSYTTYNVPEIVNTAKLGRLRWLGHPTRANETPSCKGPAFSKPEGTKRAGGPSLRWLESVEKDLRMLGVRGWKTKVLIGNYGGGQDPHRVVAPVEKIRYYFTDTFFF
jgi:hypothetical protein